MRVRVTITKIERVEFRDRQYQKIADSGNEKDNGAQYGYVEFDSAKNTETKIFEQDVDDIDVKAVIKAVNGL